MKDINTLLLMEFRSMLKLKAKASKAPGMEAYMRDQFNFIGVMSTDRRLVVQQLVPQFLWNDQNDFLQFVEMCWREEPREFKYVALDLSRKYIRKLNASCIPFFEHLIVTESWWDTVDGIAPQIIGRLIQGHKEKVRQQAHKWIQDENMWNKRSALILQLFYKEETDFELLAECILKTADSKEFFIEKAAGWALRQYSKTNPNKVKTFLAQNKIPSLSYREGMKFILQKGL